MPKVAARREPSTLRVIVNTTSALRSLERPRCLKASLGMAHLWPLRDVAAGLLGEVASGETGASLAVGRFSDGVMHPSSSTMRPSIMCIVRVANLWASSSL